MSRSRCINKKKIPFFFVILFTIISIFFFRRFVYIVKPTNIIVQNQSLLPMKRTLVYIPKQTTSPSKTHSIRCIVYIYRRHGRLGNRMFIIATGYAFARLHSCHLYLPPLILAEMRSVFAFELQSFLLPLSTFKSIIKNVSNPMKKITRYIGCQYIPELTHPNAVLQGTMFEIKGFWQSYLHFANYRDEIRDRMFIATQSVLKKVSIFFIDLYQQKFDFKPQFSLENHPSFKNQLVQSNRTTWIGIHIRRSDFVPTKYSSSDEYLFNAIEFYTTRYPNAYFIVASDDKDYCENLFRNQSNIFLTPRSFSAGDDLITLSLCQHSIITGGTFGWWAAYLANGEVVHDTVYPIPCKKDEHYYPPWFKTDVEIRLHKHT